MSRFPNFGADRLGDYASFTDESSITGHRYMIVGGVTCRTAHALAVHERVEAIRAKSRFPSDSFQWKHYRDDKWDDYKRIVDFFLDDNASQRLDFSCIIIDTHQLNHRRYNDGDGETFFQKMICEHAIAMTRNYAPSIIRILHGHRDSRYDLLEVRKIINNTLARNRLQDRYEQNYRPLRQLDYIQVPESGPTQIADILLGAVSYYWNPGLRAGGTSRKRKLAEYISAECCAASLAIPTPKSMPHFDIWKLRLRGDPRA